MSTLVVSPIIAVSLMSATVPLTRHSTAGDNRTVAVAFPRVPASAVPDIVDRATPSPSLAPVAPPAARPAAPRRKALLPTVAAGPPASPGSIVAIIEAAAARWGVSGAWMVSIARCESGLRPTALNPRGPYIGLFQFLTSTFTHNGGTNIYDPTDQSNIAAKMLAHGQAHQWSCA
jgi:soluble lytic murein transglycosylase-like protein